MNPIQNDYGTLYLSNERAGEYKAIINKHLIALMQDLRQNGLIPMCLSIAKTSVYEAEYIKNK